MKIFFEKCFLIFNLFVGFRDLGIWGFGDLGIWGFRDLGI